MQFNIGNNEHLNINLNKNNIKKFMAMAALGFTVLTAVGCHGEKKVEEVTIETQENYAPYVHRYNDIEYVVEWNDTLSEIVGNYESDYNLISRYVKDIQRENNISGALQAGTTIKLYGVPENKLEDYGYTADYSVIGYDAMVRDAYNWLLDGEKWLTDPRLKEEDLENYKRDLADFGMQYNAYLIEFDPIKKGQILDELVEALEDVLQEFKGLSGLDFADHHTAYPIPEKVSYQNNL